MRRATSLTIAALATTALLATPAGAGAVGAAAQGSQDGASAVSSASDAAKPKVSKHCKKVLKKRSKAIKGKTFGSCMVRAMTTSKTFKVTTRSAGFTDVTTYRYGSTVDFDSRSEGVRLVAVGADAWLYAEELGGWTVANPHGTAEQQSLATTVKDARKQVTAKAMSRPYTKGSSWKHTGRVKTIKGVKAWEYKGSTKGSFDAGVKVLKERVWLDRNFRQVKSSTKVRTQGVTFTMTQSFTGYGKKVDLAAGTPRG